MECVRSLYWNDTVVEPSHGRQICKGIKMLIKQTRCNSWFKPHEICIALYEPYAEEMACWHATERNRYHFLLCWQSLCKWVLTPDTYAQCLYSNKNPTVKCDIWEKKSFSNLTTQLLIWWLFLQCRFNAHALCNNTLGLVGPFHGHVITARWTQFRELWPHLNTSGVPSFYCISWFRCPCL